MTSELSSRIGWHLSLLPPNTSVTFPPPNDVGGFFPRGMTSEFYCLRIRLNVTFPPPNDVGGFLSPRNDTSFTVIDVGASPGLFHVSAAE